MHQKYSTPGLALNCKVTNERAWYREFVSFSRYVESMLKRLFSLFGFVAMGFGVYFVVVEHTKASVCNTIEGKYVGFGVSPACQHVVYAYFGGFILLAVGAMVVVFGLLATRKAAKRRYSAKNPSLASQYQSTNSKTEPPTQP
jgi:hypothetical protein